MNSILFAVIIIGFCIEIWFISDVSGDGSVSVTTNNGVINGQSEEIDGIEFNKFLGIPFAEPPIGDLRFKKPVPVNNWTEPFNATQLPNACYQIPFTDTFLNTNFSEDCLYLNIWQPISSEGQNNSKAVMFFIHGGGFVAGSSSEYQFQGQILSTKGDVILVSVNYRLNALGFLYTGTDDAPGNVGLWDTVLSLKWVRDNIGYFGGDPNRITIFGHSSGSWAVSAHILSPISRNLFRYAIMMSGAVINPLVATKAIAKHLWLKGAKLIGCANSTDHWFNTRIINCLQNASADALIGIIYLPEVQQNYLDYSPMMVIDGVFLPKSPVEMLERSDYKRGVKLMIGTVYDEGQPLASIPGYGATPSNFTYNESIANLKDFLTQAPHYRVIDTERAATLYYALISPQSTDYELLRLTTAIAFGDYFAVCPAKVFAETVLKYSRHHRSANVYEYYYTSELGPSVYCYPWMGACHGADLTPVFGLPFIYYSNYTDAQRNESVRVIGVYSHFAKYGYPSPQNGISWPKYYELNGNIVTPYLNIGTNEWEFGYGLKITECQYLWKKYFYVKLHN